MGDEVSLTSEQERALALDRNVAVTAGAGTGKTYTLKERYRHILERHPRIEPEEVLVITFTNDAANELEERIRAVVAEELDRTIGEDYTRWRHVRDGLEDAYIHTIHAFCSRILREFAPAAAIDPEFETLDETEADRLAAEAISSTLDIATEPGGTSATDESSLAGDIRRLSRVYTRSRLERLLAKMLTRRPESTSWARRWVDATPEAYLETMLERFPPVVPPSEALALIGDVSVTQAIADLCEVARLDFPFEPEDDPGLEHIRSIERAWTELDRTDPIEISIFFERLCDIVTTGGGSSYSERSKWRYQGSVRRWRRDHDLEDEHEQVEAAFDTLIERLDPGRRDLDHRLEVARAEAPYAISLVRLFDYVHTEYEQRKERRGALDYADLIEQATDLLRTSEPTRETLSEQFRYLMVDEVQDTDPRQWDIVRLLSGDIEDRYDGGNVFLVGDEKQSIYRFRGADVAAFQRERERMSRSNPDDARAGLELTANFRTLEVPLAFCNQVFDSVFRPSGFELATAEGDHEEFEARPQRLTFGRSEGSSLDGSVEYLLVPHSEVDAEELNVQGGVDPTAVSPAEREAFAVAARLTQLFASDTEVFDPEVDATVQLAPRHVAMLFRTKTRLETFERALEAYDIPYTNLVGSGFYDTPEIRPLLNLLRTLEDPTDDVSLYGTLRSPLFGIDDETIAPVAGRDGPLWEAMDEDTRLAEARDHIERWRSAGGLAGEERLVHWSSLITRVIDETGYFASVGADERPRQAVANIEKFRERIRSWEDASALSLSTVIERMETEREGDTDPAEATIPGDIEGVQLRTIHGSKGLQFPMVVVPELSRQFRFRPNLPSGYLQEVDGEVTLGLKTPDPNASFSTVDSPAYVHARERTRQEERAEEKRVLYVAMTRTRDHLLLSGLHKADDGTLQSPNQPDEATSFIDWLQPLLLDEGVPEGLTDDQTVQGTIGSTPYRVSRPTPATPWREDKGEPSLPTALDVETPPRTPTRVRISATGFRDALLEQGRISVDHEVAADADEVVSDELGPLDASTFGEIVHKLCELRPPESAWPETIQHTRPTPHPLDTEVVESIARHARTGIGAVRSLHSTYEVDDTFDEFPITLRLDSGRIVGDIDHLAVANGAFHVIDYKTSNLTRHPFDELVAHYLPQLRTYACALYQGEPSLSGVNLHLVFTQTGDVYEEHLEPSDLDRLVEQYESVLGELRGKDG